jgi:hypothetical protein
MVRIARLLLAADRSGDWSLHLEALVESLPIFAAAGHSNYLKSAYHYVQQMLALEEREPTVHNLFSQGLHVVRRTDQFWAGLSPDLVIEQTLMRTLKGRGGLTHGSGMDVNNITHWTLSLPITSSYNAALQEFEGLTTTSNDQHKEVARSRVERDKTDTDKIASQLKTHSPFASDPSLRNIVTGLVARPECNVQRWQEVGAKMVDGMVGTPIFSFSFRRGDKVKTLGDEKNVKVADGR